jgi:hypothetical protein
VTIGNFEDDLKRLSEVDWIIEAVVENLDIKRALSKKVEAVRKPGTIVTTNTSGLPVGRIAEGFSDEFRWAWFGTHFFNPPRYGCESIPRRKLTAPPSGSCPLQRCESGQSVVSPKTPQLHRQSHRHIFRAQRDAADAEMDLTVKTSTR